MVPILNSSILQASALNFSYPGKQLLSDFTACFPPGITLIRGGDGSGKSTLLRLLAGLMPAHSGQLHINGVDWQSQRQSYQASVFLADPRAQAFDQLTALAYFQLQLSTHHAFDDAVLADMISGLGLQEHLQKQLFMLSTGSKRKVFLAAAFAARAAITLLDAPFAALDAASSAFLSNKLKGEQSRADRVWVLADYAAPEGLHFVQMIDLGD